MPTQPAAEGCARCHLLETKRSEVRRELMRQQAQLIETTIGSPGFRAQQEKTDRLQQVLSDIESNIVDHQQVCSVRQAAKASA